MKPENLFGKINLPLMIEPSTYEAYEAFTLEPFTNVLFTICPGIFRISISKGGCWSDGSAMITFPNSSLVCIENVDVNPAVAIVSPLPYRYVFPGMTCAGRTATLKGLAPILKLPINVLNLYAPDRVILQESSNSLSISWAKKDLVGDELAVMFSCVGGSSSQPQVHLRMTGH